MWAPVQYVVDNWEKESYPIASDLRYILAFATFFPILRFFLDTFLYEPVGRHLIFKKARELSKGRKETLKEPLLNRDGKPANGTREQSGVPAADCQKKVQSVEEIDRDALEKTHTKFKESCWKCLYYTSAFTFAVMVSAGEPWLQDVRNYFLGPGDLRWPDQTMKLKLKALFMYVGGFYAYSIFALLFWETRRKDFVVSMVHHLASVGLAIFAYLFRFGRPASLVVAIHDASDIFLELAKLGRYLNVEIVASMAFVLFAVSWAVLRLWCFPKYIVYASSYVVLQVLDRKDHVYDGPPLYYLFNFILILLQIMHVYWWILILRVLIKQISKAGKVEGDVRSEDEDNDDD